MCMVSMMHEYARKLPPIEWTPDILETFKDALKGPKRTTKRPIRKIVLIHRKLNFSRMSKSF